MGKFSRDKGKRGEREACLWLRSMGWNAERADKSVAGKGGVDLLAICVSTAREMTVSVKYGSIVPTTAYAELIGERYALLATGLICMDPSETTLRWVPPSIENRRQSMAERYLDGAIGDADLLVLRRTGKFGGKAWPWLCYARWKH